MDELKQAQTRSLWAQRFIQRNKDNPYNLYYNYHWYIAMGLFETSKMKHNGPINICKLSFNS